MARARRQGRHHAGLDLGQARAHAPPGSHAERPRDPQRPFEALRFADDGRSLIIANEHGYPRVVLQVALDTGEARRLLWRFNPSDRPRIFEAAVSGDTLTMVYSISSETSDLYVVEPPSAR